MLTDVFITVDTEVWPKTDGWRRTALADEMRWDIYGQTTRGSFGVPYQMDVLDAHGLKGVFFVEPLFADAVGSGRLREIVALIRDRGHDVQLHIHTEWLSWTPKPLLPGRVGKHIGDFSEPEQTLLLGRALENLRAAGAPAVCAFRAGNYGANFDTLRALARLGIAYDSSYNYPYLDSACGLRTPEPLLQPRRLEGVVEFPITFFRDWPGHARHLQLTACSYREMRGVLLGAWRRGWHSVVLVSHSFELLGPRGPGRPVLPDRVVIRRFERLCRFLGQNRDKFRTATFAGLDAAPDPAAGPESPLRSSVLHTAGRIVEQVARRLS